MKRTPREGQASDLSTKVAAQEANRYAGAQVADDRAQPQVARQGNGHHGSAQVDESVDEPGG